MKAPIKILGIDPGLTTTGVNISIIDPETNVITVKHRHTLTAISIAKKESRQDYKEFGNLVSLTMYEREFINIVETHHPDFVVSEDAFYNPHRPQAYLSLKLCIHTVQRMLYHNYKKHLYLIPPTVAKQAVWKGTANKAAVQEAILHLPDLVLKDTKQNPLSEMTEHEADSIAIMYAFCKNILPDLLLQEKK